MGSNLKNGESCSIKELFSGDNKIIIPDLQRDYTWGDEKHGSEKKELVTDFCNSLYEMFVEKKDKIQLGMIYAYENPDFHINIADGQQRLTTIFILIGMLYRKLYRKTKVQGLKECLISDFELDNDDQEPYLQYTIRESTLYFLSDLTVNFFIPKGDVKVKNIKKSSWYFSEYDNDPSIQSMIRALVFINTLLEGKEKLVEFSDWLITKVELLYFDMKNREHGENMFVVINTTGEPLTVTENLKPLMLGDIKEDKYNKEWEIRESYFWKNKNKNEHIADHGVNDFLTWYLKATEKQKSIKLIDTLKKKENKEETLENIEKYFIALKKLIGYLEDDRFQNIFKQINNGNGGNELAYLRSLDVTQQNNILIPLLAFMVEFKDDNDGAYKFLRRLRKNYFDTIWSYTNRGGKYIGWRVILDNISDLNDFENWYDDADEKFKERLDRNLVVELENHKYLGGRLELFVTSLSENKENTELLKKYKNIFSKFTFGINLWKEMLNYNYKNSEGKDLLDILGWGVIDLNQWEKLLFCTDSELTKIFNSKLLGKTDRLNIDKVPDWLDDIINLELLDEKKIIAYKTNKYIILKSKKSEHRKNRFYINPKRKELFDELEKRLIKESSTTNKFLIADRVFLEKNNICIEQYSSWEYIRYGFTKEIEEPLGTKSDFWKGGYKEKEIKEVDIEEFCKEINKMINTNKWN